MKHRTIILLLVVLFLSFISTARAISSSAGRAQVSFLDVERGEFALIQATNGITATVASPMPPPDYARFSREGVEEFPYLDQGTLPTAARDGAAVELIPWSKLVFQSFRDNNWEIYLADSDGSNQVNLTNHGASDVEPRLNRGCTRVAFTSNREGNWEIYTMNLDGSGLTQLTFNTASDGLPAWSPDGTRIAFRSYRDGQAEVYVMNADGSGQTRLTWDAAYDGDAAWSPDGTLLAFVSHRAGDAIWVMNADGSGQRSLSSAIIYTETPAWSPDGSQIAFDADSDGDYRNEILLMNADGSNQRQVYDQPDPDTEAWVGSWSPDGRYVAFNRVSWIYYQGDWYWTHAYLDAWDSTSGNVVRLVSQDTEWRPDWQTTDALAPASSVNAFPAVSPGPFPVSWSGADIGEAGLLNYDVQFKDGAAGPWTDWLTRTTTTSASFSGVGGHTYYFRARARDNAYNVEPWPPDYEAFTTVEALPPITAMKILPPYSRKKTVVSWSGSDPGGSGIKGYDLQYRDGAIGNWVDWQVGISDTEAEFAGDVGHAYYFRTRGIDNAQNVENWPSGDGDTVTTLYSWGVMGEVRDNAGVPVVGVVVTTTPESLAMFPSDLGGEYSAYVAYGMSTYIADWGKEGYGDLPPTSFGPSQDAHVDPVMPPIDNIVRDWDFESGNLGTYWLASGGILPTVTDTIKHTGNYAVLLGKKSKFAPALELAPTARSPQLELDTDGVVHLVWNTGDYGTTGIFYARRTTDGTWSTPQDISQSYGEQHGGHQLALDKSGAVHVVWSRNDVPWGQDYQIYYARRGHNGTWSTLENISNTPGRSGSPQLAVEESGVVHVVWTNEPPGGSSSQTYYIRRGSDGIWSSPISIAFTGSMVVDANGTVHLTGNCDIGGFSARLCYIQRTAVGAWSDPQEISTSGGFSQLAVDASGAVHVIWQARPPGSPSDNTDIYYARRTANGSWSSPYNISNNAESSASHQLAVSEDGVVHVVWLNGGLYGDDLNYARRERDGTWFTQVIFTDDLSFNPQLALDGHQVLHVVWGNGSHYSLKDLYSIECDKNGVWSAPQRTSTPAIFFADLQLAVESDGMSHMVWVGYDAGPGTLYYVGPGIAEQTGDSMITQAMTVPIGSSAPILSFLYQYQATSTSPLEGSWIKVRVDDDGSTTTLFSTTSSTEDWTHRWFDLSQWDGQTITLTFDLHQQAGDPATWAYLDEVTVGSAHPDVWVSALGVRAAMPGETVTLQLSYGNHSLAAEALSATITATLPAGLIFASASLTPTVNGDVLTWSVGDLPPGSGPFIILVVATVEEDAVLGSTLTLPVEIATATPELEVANNQDEYELYIGSMLYLPLIQR